MKQILTRFPIFLSIFSLFWAFLLFIVISMGYNGSFVWLNSVRAGWLDALMPHFTHLGDGVLLASFVGLFFAKEYPAKVISIVLSLLMVSLTIGLLKGQVFPDWERPLTVFKDGPDFFFIGLKSLKFNSFPSGHSAAVAVVCAWLGWIYAQKKWQQLLWAVIGIGVCYSRVYIGVHFPADILIGSVLGVGIFVFTASVVLPPIRKWNHNQSEKGKRITYVILLLLLIFLLIGDIWRLYTNFYQI